MAAIPRQTRACRRRLWTRRDYHRMGEMGLFDDRRVELLSGVIYDVSPQNARHFYVLQRIYEVLGELFGDGAWVRSQGPLALDPRSEPEPDVSVVPGRSEDYREQHPSEALLVVEVALSSLAHDRTKKARVYAAAGIPEYWIVDLAVMEVEVLRDPGPAAGTSRPGYRPTTRHGLDAEIAPSAKPDALVSVRRLLGD